MKMFPAARKRGEELPEDRRSRENDRLRFLVVPDGEMNRERKEGRLTSRGLPCWSYSG